jgi:hypothetical protein
LYTRISEKIEGHFKSMGFYKQSCLPPLFYLTENLNIEIQGTNELSVKITPPPPVLREGSRNWELRGVMRQGAQESLQPPVASVLSYRGQVYVP